MANIKTLKKQLKTTKSTFKITSAMKLVSAAKMTKFQDLLLKSEAYTKELEKIVYTCAALNKDYRHPLLETVDNKHTHVLVLSSDRGLCGSYNNQLAAAVYDFLEDRTDLVKLSFWGTKAKDIIQFDNTGKEYIHETGDVFEQFVERISKDFLRYFEQKEVGAVYVAYNSYKGSGSYIPVIKKVLPFKLDDNLIKEVRESTPFDFIYEPDSKFVLDKVLPQAFSSIFHSCFLNAEATEHAARMIAMDNAAKNCEEAIQALNLKINKRRQASITRELIEIVSGAESL